MNAWSILSGDLSHVFVRIHRVALLALNASTLPRIQAYVDIGFERGHDWITKLGFTLEAPRMRRFNLDGSDAALYARTR